MKQTEKAAGREMDGMGLNLADVLGALLNAEDEAAVIRSKAELEAKNLVRSVSDQFTQDQEVRLKAARTEVKEQLESARAASEREAEHILELGARDRESMKEHFGTRMPSIVKKIAEEFALQYASRGEH
ncbi:MAG: hypothetical protein GX256_03990 [Fretibacterium sp.]|nr:hypothetical protein [Fretibacterium sp.]